MAFLAIAFTILALPIGFFLWSAQCLARNCAIAKASGIPYITRWVAPINPFWLLYGTSIVKFLQRFGLATDRLRRIYPFGWEANERATIHEEHGEMFLVAHPGGLQLCVANAETIYDILQRRTDFRRNMEEFAVINVYGKNLATTDDQEWQRHRKMTAVTFTEKNNELVWVQSLAQAKGMLDYWLVEQKGGKAIRTVHDDTKIFTLNVLAAALFDQPYPFEGYGKVDANKRSDDQSYQYRDSLGVILISVIQILVFGEEGLKAWWTPKSFKRASAAVATFRSYILTLMNEERAHIAEKKPDRDNLVARLVRACNEVQVDGPDKNVRNMTLTETEIISNLFVYAFAGNDTTAVGLTNILIHMAANPETQDWISEELNHYLSGSDPHAWTYDSFFKLKRCQAVIMESLRICHPLSQLVKTVNNTPQPIKVNDKSYTIPAGTSVHCSLPALHTLPRYWGSSAMTWNPSRFISTPGLEGKTATFEHEVLAPDTSEHFLPWAWGQRVCPGKRFSQAEIAAVLAVMFRDWKLDVVCEGGESPRQATERAWRESLVIDHEGHMLHEMEAPESIGLRWARR
ncbi:cytochrome P450 monooxygenase-like protein [Aaosphaeria arxii CBS 175.79]|uniref:Cytochrome P450 monooxygenase-like protein n=1 Tax=Aaosphaeria arxii CBS 175.79 TaxID=1450172 RepID=A0A6A5Y2S2_9PLEO|nr:cytochrome P450 monooxygenase-like protein [Aaosphaeria arxii CBS 175.79]KAF2019855.1 cytochrome P450 monooxygenase-like protein [Aaosphaeria arxii CBS 175.79]